MKDKQIKILYKEPFREFEERTIENNLEVLQELVGGYIETVSLQNNIIIICNEEGKLMGLHPNIVCGKDIIVGNALFVGFDGREDFASLNDIQKAWVLKNY